MNRVDRDAVVALWTAGKPAPYALYRMSTPLVPTGVLVEAVGSPSVPNVIARGEPVTEAIAAAVKAQMFPPELPPVEATVLVRGADGKPMLDADGNAVTEVVTVTPEPFVHPLSTMSEPVPYEQDMHCDMCGVLREELFQIGDGWYDKVVSEMPGDSQARSCFDRRLAQLGG